MILRFRFFHGLALVLCLFGAQIATARVWQDGTPGSIGSGSDLMVYRYYLPADYSPEIDYPLVLILHGSGGTGTDNVLDSYFNPLIDKTEFDFPAIVVYPQLPTRSGWGPDNPEDRTDEILADLMSTYSFDMNRLYVTGASMGGFGSMTYLQHYNVYDPGTYEFAATVPLAGAFVETAIAAPALSETPIWMLHGGADTWVSPDFSRDTYRAIAGLGENDPIPFGPSMVGGPTAIDGNLRYTEIPGLQHSEASWHGMYSDDQLLNWIFSQTLRPLTGVEGDVNQDGVLNGLDIDDLIEGWNSNTRHFDAVDRIEHGDLNLNGRTHLDDVYVLRKAFAAEGLGSLVDKRLNAFFAGVPEPSSLVLSTMLVVGCLPLRRASSRNSK